MSRPSSLSRSPPPVRTRLGDEHEKALTTLLAALAFGLAACAGDDEGDGGSEFASQVNAVCAEYGPKIALIPPPAEDVDEWAAIGADVGDLLESSVNELRLLAPPEDLSDEYADWLELRTAITTTTRELQNAGGLHDEADPLAEELGFEDCSPTGINTGR